VWVCAFVCVFALAHSGEGGAVGAEGGSSHRGWRSVYTFKAKAVRRNVAEQQGKSATGLGFRSLV
jgi:hypothetical protein